MIKRIMLLMLALSMVLAGAGCGTGATEHQPASQPQEEASKAASGNAFPLTITDDSGVQVTIEKQPERIVSLVPSTTEIAFALGLGDKVVGVSDHDDYPEDVKTKEKIGGLEVNMEKILSLKPDLVLGTAQMTAKAVESLRKLGLTVVAVEPKTIEDVYKSIELIGQVTGATDQARDVISRMEQERKQVREALKDLKPEDRPRVWLELDETLYTAGRGTIIHQLIEEAGGVNVAADTEGWPQYSAEKVIQANPDVILVNYDYVPNATEKVKQRPGWETVNAVKNNRVYQNDQDIVSRPGPRITQALVQFAKHFHPDAF